MKLKVNNKEYNPISIELPDHTEQLEKATGLLEKVEKDLGWYKDLNKQITLRTQKELLYITCTVLDIVGELSTTRFEVREVLEQQYNKAFLKTPRLGKMLYLKHYEEIHRPYDKLKNKAFNLMKKIDPKNKIEII